MSVIIHILPRRPSPYPQHRSQPPEEVHLVVEDPVRAVQELKRIGYYRLSGYLYPLRKIAPDNSGKTRSKRPESLDTYVDGAAFEDGVRLHDFDHRVTQVLLDEAQQIEIGLRVKIGYVLGKRSPLAHLDTAVLGCRAQWQYPRFTGRSCYEVWREEYGK